jgi:hypothetical protein
MNQQISFDVKIFSEIQNEIESLVSCSEIQSFLGFLMRAPAGWQFTGKNCFFEHQASSIISVTV